MSGVLGKIFSVGAKELVGEIGNTVDKLTTTKEEKEQLKQNLINSINNHYKELADFQSSIILSESKGNKLQRSWRPILGLSFGFIVVATYFIFPTLNLWIKSEDLHTLILELKDNSGFWSLMKLMIGGYVASRGVEKVAETLTQSESAKEKAKGLKRFFNKEAKG